MEVHHHPHIDSDSHRKKGFKEYFLEFVMIFLAVTLGFIAENIREHISEKNRENEYIRSLTTDLNDDINNLDSIISFEKTGTQQLDTLIGLLNNPNLAREKADEMYYVARQGPREFPFAVTSRTIDQLKSSGGFLLIRNVEASNQIIDYYNHFSPIKLLENNYDMEFGEYEHVAAKIFDPEILRRQESNAGVIMRSNDSPTLLTYDNNLLKQLAFSVVQMGGSRRYRLGLLKAQKLQAEKLKSYLQKEYHLKNE
ncbi:MAG: hypothetical protein ACTHNG_05360 [Ginsengibacter sp.]